MGRRRPALGKRLLFVGLVYPPETIAGNPIRSKKHVETLASALSPRFASTQSNERAASIVEAVSTTLKLACTAATRAFRALLRPLIPASLCLPLPGQVRTRCSGPSHRRQSPSLLRFASFWSEAHLGPFGLAWAKTTFISQSFEFPGWADATAVLSSFLRLLWPEVSAERARPRPGEHKKLSQNCAEVIEALHRVARDQRPPQRTWGMLGSQVAVWFGTASDTCGT